MSPAVGRGPLPVARRAQLLDALQRHGTVRISELTSILGVTAVTVRRDITQLADEGRVRRVHGGVTLAQPLIDAVAGRVPETVDGARSGAALTADMVDTSTPSQAARIIGILVPSLDYYWPDVVRGAEETARACGFRVVLRRSSYETDDDQPQLNRLVESVGVDGLMVALNLSAPGASETIAWLATAGPPVVLLERSASIAPHHQVMESVVTDHALGAAMAVHHLASLGHTRIGLVTSLQSPTSPHVRRGWLEGLTELDMKTDATVEARVPTPQSPGCDEALDGVLARCAETQTTALLVHADAEAMALVQRCEDRGITVPDDLSIVAYDDEVASLFSPALSAVRPPRRSIGRAAVGLLTARLADPNRPAHRVIISPTLHVRHSSSAPRNPVA